MMLYCQTLEQWGPLPAFSQNRKSHKSIFWCATSLGSSQKKFFVYWDFKNRQYNYIFTDKLDQFVNWKEIKSHSEGRHLTMKWKRISCPPTQINFWNSVVHFPGLQKLLFAILSEELEMQLMMMTAFFQFSVLRYTGRKKLLSYWNFTPLLLNEMKKAHKKRYQAFKSKTDVLRISVLSLQASSCRFGFIKVIKIRDVIHHTSIQCTP